MNMLTSKMAECIMILFEMKSVTYFIPRKIKEIYNKVLLLFLKDMPTVSLLNDGF